LSSISPWSAAGREARLSGRRRENYFDQRGNSWYSRTFRKPADRRQRLHRLGVCRYFCRLRQPDGAGRAVVRPARCLATPTGWPFIGRLPSGQKMNIRNRALRESSRFRVFYQPGLFMGLRCETDKCASDLAKRRDLPCRRTCSTSKRKERAWSEMACSWRLQQMSS
jgi:hypothetical protein